MKITLELDPHEAHFLLPGINQRRLAMLTAAAKARNEQAREYAEIAATVLARIESTLCDQMFPEPKVTEYL